MSAIECPFCGERMDRHGLNGSRRFACSCGFFFDLDGTLPRFPDPGTDELRNVPARREIIWQIVEDKKNNARPPDHQDIIRILSN